MIQTLDVTRVIDAEEGSRERQKNKVARNDDGERTGKALPEDFESRAEFIKPVVIH